MTIARKTICGFLAAAIAFAPSVGLNAATTDPDAGTWRMIVLTGPTQVPVPLPAQVTSLDTKRSWRRSGPPKAGSPESSAATSLFGGAAACCAGTS